MSTLRAPHWPSPVNLSARRVFPPPPFRVARARRGRSFVPDPPSPDPTDTSQSTLTGDPENPTKSNDVSYAFGWGVGLFAGLLITIPVSGGHINPAITLMLASFRGFPWRKVPGYWTAQITGAFIAASVVQGLYYQLLDQYEGGRGLRTWKTATLFIDVASAWESDIGECPGPSSALGPGRTG